MCADVNNVSTSYDAADRGNGLRYASAPVRRERIAEIVRASSYSPAAELSRLLGVSEMTIRRDLRALEARGVVRAVRGGAAAVRESLVGTDFRLRAAREREAKRAIAQAALGLIRADTTIALDAGTTTLELARLVRPPLRLSVVTPSLPAMVMLSDWPGIDLVGLGGVLHTESQAFAGPATLAALRSLRVNQLFLATSAIGHGALWCGNPWDAETKRELATIADEVILLADASKFGATAMTSVGPISVVDRLVVDGAITEEQRAMVAAAGVEVVVADASEAATRQAEEANE
jgi:DeoR/GlpR family transcriptional regulator of sugar metabolism